MKAISIRQPWAWAILHAGKDIENRDWKPTNPGLRFRGPVALHASAGMTRDEYRDATDTIEAIHNNRIMVPPLVNLDRGGIVGTATIVDIVTFHRSEWFFGHYGLVLADVRPTIFQPFKGALGFFDVPDEMVRARS